MEEESKPNPGRERREKSGCHLRSFAKGRVIVNIGFFIVVVDQVGVLVEMCVSTMLHDHPSFAYIIKLRQNARKGPNTALGLRDFGLMDCGMREGKKKRKKSRSRIPILSSHIMVEVTCL